LGARKIPTHFLEERLNSLYTFVRKSHSMMSSHQPIVGSTLLALVVVIGLSGDGTKGTFSAPVKQVAKFQMTKKAILFYAEPCVVQLPYLDTEIKEAGQKVTMEKVVIEKKAASSLRLGTSTQ
jgi:hypothetical protein